MNIEHRTLNIEHRTGRDSRLFIFFLFFFSSTFDVGRSMFDVP